MTTERAEPSGISLNEVDAALIKGMIGRGDRQHDIAAYFGVNGGRIAEIASEAKFQEIGAADKETLPSPGPYLSGRQSSLAMKALIEARDAIDASIEMIERLNK